MIVHASKIFPMTMKFPISLNDLLPALDLVFCMAVLTFYDSGFRDGE